MKNRHLKANRNSLINLLIKDDVLSSGRSESEILNRIILDYYVDPYWYPVIKAMYEDHLTLGQTLELVWMNTDVIGNRDMSRIVKYAAEASQQGSSDLPNPANPEWHHFCSLLEALKLYIEYESKKSESIELDRTVTMLSDLVESYKNWDIRIGLSVIYQIILDNWDYLQSKVEVYNLLQSMAEIQMGWQNLPSDRIELLFLLQTSD